MGELIGMPMVERCCRIAEWAREPYVKGYGIWKNLLS